MTTAHKPSGVQITGIGSLPHHNIDAALAYSLQMSLPFLPQIPIRNPWEYMIAQALEGLPGLEVEADGSARLNVDLWHGRASALQERLNHAFEEDSYELFEPSAATASGWQPFLWELQERGIKQAKVQLAGPLTAQWALLTSDGQPLATEIANQIFKLVLARALAMSQRLRSVGVEPILYLDEPGLYGLSKQNARHLLGVQELKLAVQTLRKKGVTVGLHCCSNTDWAMVLGLGLDILSIDSGLSLDRLLAYPDLVEKFIGKEGGPEGSGGGRLSLGVIPTSLNSPGLKSAYSLQQLDVREIFAQILAAFERSFSTKPAWVARVLREAIYTPACGLALHTVADAEAILALLQEFSDFCSASLNK